jgi:hypothetical protein
MQGFWAGVQAVGAVRACEGSCASQERSNLAATSPAEVQALLLRIAYYQSTAVPCRCAVGGPPFCGPGARCSNRCSPGGWRGVGGGHRAARVRRRAGSPSTTSLPSPGDARYPTPDPNANPALHGRQYWAPWVSTTTDL